MEEVFVQYIKIVAVPSGQAPDWVRIKWLGLEIPLDISDGIQMVVLGGEPTNIGGYSVKVCEALNALRLKCPSATRWWEENLIPGMTHLVFAKSECHLIEK